MIMTRDQRRKQAAYTAWCREKKRVELLRQAVSAEIRRAAKESLAASLGTGSGIVLVCGMLSALGPGEYRHATQVPTRITCGTRVLHMHAYPIMKGDRRIDTMYVIDTPEGDKTTRCFKSGFRGEIARQLVDAGATLRTS